MILNALRRFRLLGLLTPLALNFIVFPIGRLLANLILPPIIRLALSVRLFAGARSRTELRSGHGFRAGCAERLHPQLLCRPGTRLLGRSSLIRALTHARRRK